MDCGCDGVGLAFSITVSHWNHGPSGLLAGSGCEEACSIGHVQDHDGNGIWALYCKSADRSVSCRVSVPERLFPYCGWIESPFTGLFRIYSFRALPDHSREELELVHSPLRIHSRNEVPVWVGLLPCALPYDAGGGTNPNGAVAKSSEVQSGFWSVALIKEYLLKGPCTSRTIHNLWLGRIRAQLPGPFRILMDFLSGAPRLAKRGWSPFMGHFRVHNWTEDLYVYYSI